MALMVVALYGILLTRAATMSRTNKSCAGLKIEDKRFKGVFALRPYQPPARRVDQPGAASVTDARSARGLSLRR
jgi:hypothetical protein